MWLLNAHAHTHSQTMRKKFIPLSIELDQLVEKLDTFALEAAKSKTNFVPDRIERVISPVPSAVPPPPDAPNWAL